MIEIETLDLAAYQDGTSFLLVPEWFAPGEPWRKSLVAFFQAFSETDPVVLVMPYHEDSDSVAMIQRIIERSAAEAGKHIDDIPDTALIPLPTYPCPNGWQHMATKVDIVLASTRPSDAWLLGLDNMVISAPTAEILQAAHHSAPESSGRIQDVSNPDTYYLDDPDAYWRWRASDLISLYDNIDSWDNMREFHHHEATIVSNLVKSLGITDVLVAGCGNGRQISYLNPHVTRISGFDLAFEMVLDARSKHPGVPIYCQSLEGCSEFLTNSEAVLSSTVLMCILPDRIEAILRELTMLAEKYLILVECTQLEKTTSAVYNFAHDYVSILERMGGWELIHREPVSETDVYRSELMAWKRILR